MLQILVGWEEILLVEFKTLLSIVSNYKVHLVLSYSKISALLKKHIDSLDLPFFGYKPTHFNR